MKKVLLALSLLSLCPVVHAAPITYIQSKNTLQSGSTIYVTSGTVRNLNTTTLKFADATTMTTAPSVSGTVLTVQRFLSGTGTYTRPTAPTPLYLIVKMVGAGGGGGGGGTSGGGTGGTGGNTYFGVALSTAAGGAGGGYSSAGGAGGTTTLAAGTTSIFNLAGGDGQGSQQGNVSDTPGTPLGGASFISGGARSTSQSNAAGQDGKVNRGEGGQGGGGTASATSFSGAGGGAGGYLSFIIASPATSYPYGVGAGGTVGSAGTSGNAGGAGGSGQIVIEEHYQ